MSLTMALHHSSAPQFSQVYNEDNGTDLAGLLGNFKETNHASTYPKAHSRHLGSGSIRPRGAHTEVSTEGLEPTALSWHSVQV